jgi:uncharacterized protein (TIGR03435 family)
MGRATVLTTIAIYLTTAALMAQTQTPRFEVASVRMSADDAHPMTSRMTDSRVDIAQPMQLILLSAFRVQANQLSAPDWLNQTYVEISATMPAGSTVAQVPEMLQTLLTERFGLAIHRESRPMDAYELVTGPDGMKMREVEPVDDLKRQFPVDPSRTPRDTTQETTMGQVRTISIPRGLRRITSRTMYERTISPSGTLIVNATRMNMVEFVSVLQGNLGTLPVVDNTGLTGLYQFTIELPNDAGAAVLAAGAAAFRATQGGSAGVEAGDRRLGIPAKALEGLGLKLERRRVPIEVVVVDKISRTPTEN